MSTSVAARSRSRTGGRARGLVALFDFADVFEDFYPHLGVDHAAFAASWGASGNHRFASLLQEHVADVRWYSTTLRRSGGPFSHELGFSVVFSRSSSVHRLLWRWFYAQRWSWRVRRAYRLFALVSSYCAPLSRDLVRALRRDRPDAFFVQDYSSGRFDVLLVMSRLFRVPLFAYHSGSTADAYSGALLRRATLRHAEAVIVSSRKEGELVTARFGVDPARCHVVLTPIDLDVFRPTPRRDATARAGLDGARRYFVYVGRLDDAVKRVTSLLRAFASAARDAPDVRLIVVGDGPDAGSIRATGTGLFGDRVAFRGWEPDPVRLADLYASAEALVLPSLREGFPTVVGESLACGTPVIASDVGGIGEVVDDDTGWLLPPGDETALAAALREAVEHPDALRALRANARRRATERVAPEIVARQLQDVVAAVWERR